jgi:hypothetical protein
VFERTVKGMRDEVCTVLWELERNRDVSSEALRCLMRNGWSNGESMSGVSDGMAREGKERERKRKKEKERKK